LIIHGLLTTLQESLIKKWQQWKWTKFLKTHPHSMQIPCINIDLIQRCINIGSTLICDVDPTSFFNIHSTFKSN
jgi:hypothetical protein